MRDILNKIKYLFLTLLGRGVEGDGTALPSQYLQGIGYVFNRYYGEGDSFEEIGQDLEQMVYIGGLQGNNYNPYAEGMAFAIIRLENLEERLKKREEKLNAIRFLTEEQILEIK